MRWRAIVVVVALAGLLASCSGFLGFTRQTQLAQHQAKWAAHAPRSYRFRFSAGGMAGSPAHTITVVDGRATVSPPYDPGDVKDRASFPQSLTDVFAAAKQVMSVRGDGTRSVDYDPRYGYPSKGGFDITEIDGHGVTDDFWGFEVSDFVVLRS